LLQNVTVSHGALPVDLPTGYFDLIVLSEIGYYLKSPELAQLSTSLVSRLDSQGILLAAHWLGISADHLLSGDQVHEILGATPELVHTKSERHEGFRLDIWKRIHE
jgi:hypothetical protein